MAAYWKYLEIEELVTLPKQRSNGYDSKLFDWLCGYAQHKKCSQVRLLSGVKRLEVHRFYERKGVLDEAAYFSIDVSACTLKGAYYVVYCASRWNQYAVRLRHFRLMYWLVSLVLSVTGASPL